MQRPPTDRWGVGAGLLPLEGGCRNRVFRTTGLRRNLVFKSTRRTPDAVAWLVEVHDIARRCGFVVPRLVRSRNGNLVEAGWTCELFVSGATLSVEDLPEIAPNIAEFHLRSAGLPQRPGFLSSRDLLEKTAGGDVDLDLMPPGLVARCRDAWRAVCGGRFSVVHGDLNPGNLLRCRDGRIALLDWDECRRDLVLFDTGQVSAAGAAERRAILAWEAACSWQIEPDHARQVAGRI